MSDAEIQLPLGVSEIEKFIPHRFPFLLIDRVLDFKRGEYIKALKVVSVADPNLQGHFPGNPVMPGVLIVEALAQASAVLGKLTAPDTANTCLLTEIKDTRFRKVVVPGDMLELEVRVVRHRKVFFWFEGEAKVDGAQVASASFCAKLA